MSVLKGEGRNVILYGSTAVPTVRPLPVYLARPDVGGRHRVVVVAHDAITPSIKAMCRRLARHGLGVVCPDLFRSRGPDGPEPARVASDLDEAFGFAVGSGWGAPAGAAVLGIGSAGALALRGVPSFATRVVVMGAPVGSAEDPEAPARSLIGLARPLLGLYGAEDDQASVDEVRALGSETGEWIIYPGAGRGFFDEGSDSYLPEVAEDAFARVLRFLGAD
jgi:dienelactone hydrolase